MPTVAAVIEFLERLAPPALAADWDNVGLLLGERTAEVRRIMTCLTVTPDSAAEAVAEGAGLIVTHHPILFRAVKRLTDATPEGRTLLALARAGVAVYSPHTAFDDAEDGINALLARRLGLIGVGPLRRREAPVVQGRRVHAGEGPAARFRRDVRRRRRPHRPVQRVQFSLARHGDLLRLRGEQPDRRPKGPARGGDRVAAGGGLSRRERGRGDGGDPAAPTPTRSRRSTFIRCGQRRRGQVPGESGRCRSPGRCASSPRRCGRRSAAARCRSSAIRNVR